ncbi:MAG: hypothetical protein WAV95_04875 [Azonexus sp.]
MKFDKNWAAGRIPASPGLCPDSYRFMQKAQKNIQIQYQANSPALPG